MGNLFDGISKQSAEKLLDSLKADSFTCQRGISISYLLDRKVVGVVTDGYLEVIKIDYNGDKSIIETIGKNQAFGNAVSLINNYNYDIIAIEESKIILIEYDKIINYSEKVNKVYQKFLTNFLVILTSKLRGQNERIEILSQKSIRNKLLTYFEIMSRKNNSKNIYLPYTFSDLAAYLAVDRSAMSRELNNLKKEGFISVKHRLITLLY
ncbi:MAG: Crp/Fnr family transcriptional regulator [Bacilli bacterium]|nr:Crp/Fnr family transcriptional regulator [Bacilli bacterium]